MDIVTLSSTLLLTLLLGVGLLFFLKASVKDRTEHIDLVVEESQDSILNQLQQYFVQRAYRVINIDREQSQVIFEGQVRPSWFMAIFLSVLSAVGILCLALVVAILWPAGTFWPLTVVVISPLTGILYWKQASKVEQVLLKFRSEENNNSNVITITGHRDELAILQDNFKFKIPSESLGNG